jgi:hypothetical protein
MTGSGMVMGSYYSCDGNSSSLIGTVTILNSSFGETGYG